MATSGAETFLKTAKAGRSPSDGVATNAWSGNGGTRLIKTVKESGDANSRAGPALLMDATAREKFAPLANFFERHRTLVQRRDPIWKIILKGKVNPKAETLEMWSDAILRNAKDYALGTTGIEIIMDSTKEEFEIIFDGPVLVAIGETMLGCKVVGSLSMHPDFSAFNGKWARNPGMEPAEIADCAFAYCGVHAVAAYTCGEIISAIIEGNPVGLMGKRGGVVTIFDGTDSVPLWQIAQDPLACFRCGARGHIAVKCPWDPKGAQKEGTQARFPLSLTAEWSKGEMIRKCKANATTVGVTNQPPTNDTSDREKEGADTRTLVPNETVNPESAMELDDETMDGAMEDDWNFEELEEKARIKKEEMRLQREKQEAATHELITLAKWEPEADTPDELIEKKAETIAEATMVLGSMGEGIPVTKNQASRSLRHTRVVKRARKSIMEEELIVVECGGEGHCGPLSLLAAMVAQDGQLGQLNLEKVRNLARKGREKKDEWWTGEHFIRASKALQQPIVLVEDAPTCWRTAMEVSIPISEMDKKPVFIIGGSVRTGHFRAIIKAKKGVDKYINHVFENTVGMEDFAKVKVVGTLCQVWETAGVKRDTIPEERVNVKVGEEDITGEGKENSPHANGEVNKEAKFGDPIGNEMQQ